MNEMRILTAGCHEMVNLSQDKTSAQLLKSPAQFVPGFDVFG